MFQANHLDLIVAVESGISDDYLIGLKPLKVYHFNMNHSFDGLEWKRLANILAMLKIDRTIPNVTCFFKWETSRAKETFDNFIL